MSYPVIDAHIHVQPWKMVKADALKLMQDRRPDGRRIQDMMYDPAEFLKYLDDQRIDKVVAINYVSPDIMGFTDEVNPYIAGYAKKCDGRLIPIGSVHPKLEKNPAAAMDRLIALGLRGIKIHPSHQACPPNDYRNGNKALETIYKKAEEAGLILIVHTGTSIFPGARNVYADPITCDDIPIDFPKLKIVLAHGGRPLWMETATFVVRRFAHVMMDVSSIPPQKLLEYFPRMQELADKILWGSDWPAPGVPSMRDNVDRFLALPLPEEVKRKIVCDNARKLYGL